jgi:hypothetical protein
VPHGIEAVFKDESGNCWSLGQKRKSSVLIGKRDDTSRAPCVEPNEVAHGIEAVFKDQSGNCWSLGQKR